MENSRAKPPPGVEEALSSMLWTPYPDDSSESSSSDESDLESFKRRKRPLTWAVNDNHEFASARPYSISSRLSYPSYYPPSYGTTPNQHLITPKTLTHSFTDNFLSTCHQSHVEQVRVSSLFDSEWIGNDKCNSCRLIEWIIICYRWLFMKFPLLFDGIYSG